MTKPAPATRRARAAPDTALVTLPAAPLFSGVLLAAAPVDEAEPEEDPEDALELALLLALLCEMTDAVGGIDSVTPVEL